MNDLISRQAVLDIVDDLRDHMTVEGYWSAIERVKALPSAQPEVLACGEGELSAQPEIKPISYEYCANAMLKMWMDNVLTDGEYNRIMDKLNKFDTERRTGG